MIGSVPRIEVAVTRGCGMSWSLLRRDANGPADWPVGSRLWLTCQLGDEEIEVEAAIVGPRATIRLTAELCDRLLSSTRLQIVLLTPGGTRRAIATGRFVRDDGGSAMPTTRRPRSRPRGAQPPPIWHSRGMRPYSRGWAAPRGGPG